MPPAAKPKPIAAANVQDAEVRGEAIPTKYDVSRYLQRMQSKKFWQQTKGSVRTKDKK